MANTDKINSEILEEENTTVQNNEGSHSDDKISDAYFAKNYEKYVEKVVKYDKEKFNIFKVLGLTNYEIRHSNYLAWLFNNEQFRKGFLEKFKEVSKQELDFSNLQIEGIEREKSFDEKDINGNKIYICNASITLDDEGNYKSAGKKYNLYKKEIDEEKYEYYYLIKHDNGTVETKNFDCDKYVEQKIQTTEEGKKEKKREEENKKLRGEDKPIGRYIDLNIIGKDFTLTIENKIDTGEHDFQCIAYRNYMLTNYENKKQHYFVFLGKRKPDDFLEESTDKDNGLYPEYVFMDYKMVRDILSADKEKIRDDFNFADDYQKETAEQYISIINEWEKMPSGLANIFKEIGDITDFADEKRYKELSNLNLSPNEKRFVELGRQYYEELKDTVDELIKPALKKICKDKYYFMNEYGRGNYATAIPLTPSVLSDYEQRAYLKAIGKYDDSMTDKDSKKAIKKIESEKNCITKEMCFQTVDYRAPMGEINKPSIALYAGLSTPYSKELCKRLADDGFIAKLNEKKESWNIALSLYWKNGSGFNKNSRIFNVKNEDFFGDKFDRNSFLNADSIIKKKQAHNIFNTEFLDYLVDNKKHYDDSFNEWMNSIIVYFTKNEQIETVQNKMHSFLKYSDYEERFDKWFKDHKYNEKYDPEKLRSKINELISEKISDETFTNLKETIEISLFKAWLKDSLIVYEFLSSACDEQKLLNDNQKKLVKEVLKTLISPSDQKENGDEEKTIRIKERVNSLNKILSFKENNYENWLKDNYEIYKSADKLDNLIKVYGPEKTIKQPAERLKQLAFIELFRKWFEEDKAFKDDLENMLKELGDKKTQKEIKDFKQDIQDWLIHTVTVNKNNVAKSKTIKEKIEDKINNCINYSETCDALINSFSYSCSEVYLGWRLSMIFETGCDIDWTNDEKLSDEEYNEKKEEFINKISGVFRQKTLELTETFGYKDWFENNVFEPEIQSQT